jgi:hypothetical protein
MMSEPSLPNGGRIKVGFAIPSLGGWNAKFGVSLVSMVKKTMLWRPEPEEGFESLQLATYSKEISMLVASRHQLVVAALKDECTHLLFLDSDMTFPSDTLIRLLRAKKEVVAANATSRAFPVRPIAHDLNWKEVQSKKKDGLQKVQHVGCAVMLIDLSIMKKLQPPLFMMEWVPDLGDYCGEDIYFCAKLQEAGIDLWVDHTLSKQIGHEGRLVYGHGLIGVEVPPGVRTEGVS